MSQNVAACALLFWAQQLLRESRHFGVNGEKTSNSLMIRKALLLLIS